MATGGTPKIPAVSNTHSSIPLGKLPDKIAPLQSGQTSTHRMDGPAANIEVFKYLGSNPIFSSLVFQDLGVHPYIKKNEILTMNKEQYLGVALFCSLRLPFTRNDVMRQTLIVGEALMPNIPLGNFLDTASAQKMVIDTIAVEFNNMITDDMGD